MLSASMFHPRIILRICTSMIYIRVFRFGRFDMRSFSFEFRFVVSPLPILVPSGYFNGTNTLVLVPATDIYSFIANVSFGKSDNVFIHRKCL